MIRDQTSEIFSSAKSKLEASDDSYVLAIALVSLSLSSLFAWRLWAFTISPWLHPNEPTYLPYWIPIFGHAGAFFKDVNSLIARARKCLPNPKEPFILNVAGQRLVVLSSPQDVSEVLKNTTAFTFDDLVQTIHKGVANVSPDGFRTLWRKPSEGYDSLHGNPNNKVLAYRGNDLLHDQALPGPNLEELTQRFLARVEVSTRWDNIASKCILAVDESKKVVSLQSWCLNTLVDDATRAFFGDYVLQLEPSLTQIFHAWDENSWMKTYQYPDFLAGPAVRPRNQLIQTFTRYLETSREERGTTGYFVNEQEAEARHAGLSTEDSAKLMVLIYWAVNANVHKAAFWLLAYITSNPALLTSIRAETAGAITPTTPPPPSSSTTANTPLHINHHHLLDACPHTNSAFNEVLRLTVTSANVRQVVAPTVLGGKTLTPGMTVFASQRQLLTDEEGFGPTAHDLDPDRFFDDKGLEKSGFYRPFGGGTTLCSGRFLARREVLAFVAVLLWRFEVERVGVGERVLGVKGTAFPRLDVGKPSLGAASPKAGDDVVLVVRPRTM